MMARYFVASAIHNHSHRSGPEEEEDEQAGGREKGRGKREKEKGKTNGWRKANKIFPYSRNSHKSLEIIIYLRILRKSPEIDTKNNMHQHEMQQTSVEPIVH